ncbi:MAG: sugar phosphate nucleotidyltransferase [Muribaculum sp.]|nr:sugar phosphate nucleotidyltransferase [Muribaculum sp.]
MKTIILCAGLGTRLRPWTLSHPKALVPVAGVPMLKRVSDRLASHGFTDQTINVHHFASQIIDFINQGSLSAEKVHVSDESDCLLDTGGGLLHAAPFLASDSAPFLVHNVDILSDADLPALYRHHIDSGLDVTLLVSDRNSDRKLVFDPYMNLKGWLNKKTEEIRPEKLQIDSNDRILSFSGIYVMSPIVLEKMRQHGFHGKFPIMDFLLARFDDVKIGGFRQDSLSILDIGKPSSLALAPSIL